MDYKERDMREDIGIIKSDILALGKDRVWKDIDHIELVEARLYFRYIYNKALTELEEEKREFEEEYEKGDYNPYEEGDFEEDEI